LSSLATAGFELHLKNTTRVFGLLVWHANLVTVLTRHEDSLYQKKKFGK
jgi:hypothetical protein